MTNEFVQKIADIINLPKDFGWDIDDGYEDEVTDGVAIALHDAGYKCYCAAGCSKLAIVFDNEPEVIKVPLNGHWTYSQTYDEENDEYNYDYEDPIFEYYRTVDYCAKEVDAYEIAEQYGVERFFAKARHIGNFNGKPFYAQEAVLTSNDAYEKKWVTSKNNDEKASKISSSRFPLKWIALAYEHYGDDLVNKFFEFAQTNEGCQMLSDMHSNNYGYRANGEPIILDYTGFNS